MKINDEVEQFITDQGGDIGEVIKNIAKDDSLIQDRTYAFCLLLLFKAVAKLYERHD